MDKEDINLREIFNTLKEALDKNALHLTAFETDYVIRFSFSISKYELDKNSIGNIYGPEGNLK